MTTTSVYQSSSNFYRARGWNWFLSRWVRCLNFTSWLLTGGYLSWRANLFTTEIQEGWVEDVCLVSRLSFKFNLTWLSSWRDSNADVQYTKEEEETLLIPAFCFSYMKTAHIYMQIDPSIPSSMPALYHDPPSYNPQANIPPSKP